MIHELLYTSHSGKGLRQGSGGGFCTVLSSEGMANNLAMTLERLSGYKHPFDLHDARSKSNPVNYRSVMIRVGGISYYVLSRVADARAEHTGRSNKLAHHVAISGYNLPRGGPTWMFLQSQCFRETWDGEVKIVAALDEAIFPRPDIPAQVCSQWQAVAGDAGWAGEIADWLIAHRGQKPISIIIPLGTDALGLANEVFSLIPPDKRWEISFSTYFTSLAPGTTCDLRFLLNDTKEAEQLRRDKTQKLIDLSKLTATPDVNSSLVNAARDGNIVHPRKKPAIPGRSRRTVAPLAQVEEEPSLELMEAEDELEIAPPEPIRKKSRSRKSTKKRDSRKSGQSESPTEHSPAKTHSPSKPDGLPLLKIGVIGFVVVAMLGLLVSVGIGGFVLARINWDDQVNKNDDDSRDDKRDGQSSEQHDKNKQTKDDKSKQKQNDSVSDGKGQPNATDDGKKKSGSGKPDKPDDQNQSGNPDRPEKGKPKNGKKAKKGQQSGKQKNKSSKGKEESKPPAIDWPEFLTDFVPTLRSFEGSKCWDMQGLRPGMVVMLDIAARDSLGLQRMTLENKSTDDKVIWEIQYSAASKIYEIGSLTIENDKLWLHSAEVPNDLKELELFNSDLSRLRYTGLLLQLHNSTQFRFIEFEKPKKALAYEAAAKARKTLPSDVDVELAKLPLLFSMKCLTNALELKDETGLTLTWDPESLDKQPKNDGILLLTNELHAKGKFTFENQSDTDDENQIPPSTVEINQVIAIFEFEFEVTSNGHLLVDHSRRELGVPVQNGSQPKNRWALSFGDTGFGLPQGEKKLIAERTDAIEQIEQHIEDQKRDLNQTMQKVVALKHVSRSAQDFIEEKKPSFKIEISHVLDDNRVPKKLREIWLYKLLEDQDNSDDQP